MKKKRLLRKQQTKELSESNVEKKKFGSLWYRKLLKEKSTTTER